MRLKDYKSLVLVYLEGVKSRYELLAQGAHEAARFKEEQRYRELVCLVAEILHEVELLDQVRNF